MNEYRKDRLYEYCQYCLEKIPEYKQSTAKYCSGQCARAAQHKWYSATKKSVEKINTGVTGAIYELAVCAWFLQNGYYVFRSVSQSAPFDLVVYRDGELIRVEVTSGVIGKNGNVSWEKHIPENYDIAAVIVPPNDLFIFDNDGQKIDHNKLRI